jgi:uncharacterized protein (DUF1501 family)
VNTRRTFLKSSIASSSLISLSGWAPGILRSAANGSPHGEKVLVVLQLSGGNDGLNTVIPYGDDEYFRNRFTLAIPQSNLLQLDNYHGLHPSLKGFERLWQHRKLSIIQGVGYPEPNRSHFESMDLWHTAHQNTPSVRTGWLGRWSSTLPTETQLEAIHFGTERQPLALASATRTALSLRSLDTFRNESDGLSPELWKRIATARVNEDSGLLGYLQKNAGMAWEASQRLDRIGQLTASGSKYPQTELARKLSMVSTLIEADFPTRVYYVAMDGFDTHANQGESHAGLLKELGDAAEAFLDDLQQQGNGERVLLFVFSEFGRRLRENASRGTDHGAAAPVFVLGNQVRAGLVTRHPSLTDLQGGDLKHRVDYRQVYWTLLHQWLKADAKAILGRDYDPLDLFR